MPAVGSWWPPRPNCWLLRAGEERAVAGSQRRDLAARPYRTRRPRILRIETRNRVPKRGALANAHRVSRKRPKGSLTDDDAENDASESLSMFHRKVSNELAIKEQDSLGWSWTRPPLTYQWVFCTPPCLVELSVRESNSGRLRWWY